MKTMRGRSSRVLLVAAMTTSAFAGATATAGAAESTDRATTDCDPAEVQAIPDVMFQASSCDSAPALVRNVLVNAMRSDETLRVAEASVKRVFDVLHPELEECEVPIVESPVETVTGTDMTTIVGTLEDVEAEEVTDLTVDSRVETVADSAGSRSDTRVNSAVGGVVIEDTVVVEERAAAPEQVEVVGPATAATGGLPATGHDGSMLTVLGLAMIASGAAARFVARD